MLRLWIAHAAGWLGLLVAVAAGVSAAGAPAANDGRRAAHGRVAADARVPTTDLVGAFTTRYAPGEPRVINIRRAAHLLDRATIPAGGTFSLNQALGQRTRAKGFVPAPMISAGRLVDSVGGGISQVATTLYNAAFFAGLELVAHTPHSFYIDRYPMGREATISWGGPELVFRNRWRAPVRIRMTTTPTSITVRLYSQQLKRRVEAWTGRPYAFRSPGTVRVLNPALDPGEWRLLQEAGGPGFTIRYGRRVYQGNRLRERSTFVVRYEPKHRIIEVGSR